jgi:hypothetical protein
LVVKKGSKILPRICGGMPVPVSVTRSAVYSPIGRMSLPMRRTSSGETE